MKNRQGRLPRGGMGGDEEYCHDGNAEEENREGGGHREGVERGLNWHFYYDFFSPIKFSFHLTRFVPPQRVSSYIFQFARKS